MTTKQSMITALLSACLISSTAAAQTYPERPVRIVIDRPAGSPHDLLTRAVAEKLSQSLRQTFLVENRVGAGGNLAAESVVRAAPDGYTLLVALDTTLTVNPTLYGNLPFDPQKDLRPLSIMATTGTMLVVHPSIPVHSVAEFVGYARQNPIAYAHGGNGSPGHVGMEYFRTMANFPATPVAYRGNAQLSTDLVAGQIKTGFVGISGVMEHVRGGKLRGLAISSLTRSPMVPDVPTIAEAGYPDFKAEVYYVLLAPVNIPEPIAALLEREVRNALLANDLRQKFVPRGADIVAIPGAEAKARIAADARQWVKVIRDTGMRVE